MFTNMYQSGHYSDERSIIYRIVHLVSFVTNPAFFGINVLSYYQKHLETFRQSE